MARQRIPHPEFQAYAKHMERIKKIILKVHNAPVPHEPDDIGSQAQKIRRILEAIVNACLVVQMAFDDRNRLRRFVNMSRAQVLKDRVDGDHYPYVPPDYATGRPAIVVAPGVVRNEYLTRDRWFTVWDACGAMVHEDRPGSTKPKPHYDTYGENSRIWLQWIVNFLSVHTIPAKDLDYIALVALDDANTKGTLLRVQKRTTPWQPTLLLDDGRPVSLQQKIDGKWQDVTDPTEGAIALVNILGYYTATTYHTNHPVNATRTDLG